MKKEDPPGQRKRKLPSSAEGSANYDHQLQQDSQRRVKRASNASNPAASITQSRSDSHKSSTAEPSTSYSSQNADVKACASSPRQSRLAHVSTQPQLPLSGLHVLLHNSIPHYQARGKPIANRLRQLGADVQLSSTAGTNKSLVIDKQCTHVVVAPGGSAPQGTKVDYAVRRL